MEVVRVTNLERLLEALEYSKDNDMEWYEVFDSIEEAQEVLISAEKEEPDEYQLASFLTMFEDDVTFSEDLDKVYKKCMKVLKRQVKKAS